MKTVQRGNKQLRVPDDRLDEMRKAGYVEVDSKTGQFLIPPPAPDSGAALKKENAVLKKENKELRMQVRELTEQVKSLTAQGTE